jgi:hypothetical protein
VTLALSRCCCQGMRRLAFLLCLLAPLGAASAATAQERPTLRAELLRCRTGDSAATRAATFRASMPAARGTRRMAMRFELRQRRREGSRFRRVAIDGWGDWERSEPRSPGFVFTRRVQRLRPGVAYRALVVFRWYDAGGDVQREARRLTEQCAQPRP